MTDYSLNHRGGLPDALRTLEAQFPRAQWENHPNFREMIRFWMSRHNMFRRLLQQLVVDTQNALDNSLALSQYTGALVQNGGLLLQELHTHHNVEDHHYFPMLMALDKSVQRGFDLLEKDHDEIDVLLNDIANGANDFIKSYQSGGASREALSSLLGVLEHSDGLLRRHLMDEEDIVVPVVLKSGFNG